MVDDGGEEWQCPQAWSHSTLRTLPLLRARLCGLGLHHRYSNYDLRLLRIPSCVVCCQAYLALCCTFFSLMAVYGTHEYSYSTHVGSGDHSQLCDFSSCEICKRVPDTVPDNQTQQIFLSVYFCL